MEVFKILSKKTKKGQPNLNLQMEYLLKKIQEKNKDFCFNQRFISVVCVLRAFVYVKHLQQTLSS